MKNKFTIIIIPENSAKVRRLRMTKMFVQMFLIIFLGLFIFSAITVNANNKQKTTLDTNKKEIEKLTALNASQKSQIKKLENDTMEMKDQIDENVKVLSNIKKSIGLKSTNDSFNNAIVRSEVSLSEMILDGTFLSNDMSKEIYQIDNSLDVLAEKTRLQKTSIEESMKPIQEKIAYLNAVPKGKPISDAVTAPYGTRINPITHRGSEFHKGVDLGSGYGVSVHATGNGKVIFAGVNGGYGNVVIISHGYGFTTLYAHNSKLLVKTGDYVKRGQVISKAGSTGRSTGPHVHYEIKLNGKNVNPVKYF